jgi:thiamine kinase-like enzyme
VVRDEELLQQMGEAAARYHRAVIDFRPAGLVPWQSAPALLGSSEIVCHHDLAPYNIVLTGNRLKGIIDWDLAGPGSALSELAFLAWQWVPLHGPVVTGLLGWPEPPDRIRRLNLLLDSYGLEDRTGFIDEVITRIGYNRDVMVRKAAEGNQGYRSLIEQGHLVGMDEALSFLAGNGEELQHHLR